MGVELEEAPQLHMRWPSTQRVRPETLRVPEGYSVRTYQPGDELAFLHLMGEGQFGPFDETKLHYSMARAIPDGWFFATRGEAHVVCGTAMALHNYTGNVPFTGDVGWVVCSPSDRGRGVGACLLAHVTRRFLDAGYRRIQLHTEHYRLAAIKTYFLAGYLPVIYSVPLYLLWRDVCAHLDWPFTPERWSETHLTQ